MVEPKEHAREEGKRTKASAGPSIADDSQKIGWEHQFMKMPPFLEERVKLWEELYAE